MMNNRFGHMALMLSAIALVCCTSKSPLDEAGTDDVHNLGVVNGTRFSINGTSFTRDHTFGMYVCVHEDQTLNPDGLQFQEHNQGYNNIKVTRTASSWVFYNSVLKENVSNLYISSNDAHENADVYVYAPYIQAAVNPANIPFNINRNEDLMYVAENTDPTVNKDMEPGANTELTFNFHHVLAKLEFRCRVLNVSPNTSSHTIDSIVIRKAGSKTTEMVSAGTFNAMTGVLTPSATSDSVRFKNLFYSVSPTSALFSEITPKTYTAVIYPVDYVADGDYEVILVIDGFRKQFSILREDLKHSDGTTYGFKAGNSYVFNIAIDNYIHLDGITIKNDWETDSYADEI